MKRIEFYGGFHNASPIRARVSDAKFEDWRNGLIYWREMFSPYQQRKLAKHFCGIKGCTCGGMLRAEWHEV